MTLGRVMRNAKRSKGSLYEAQVFGVGPGPQPPPASSAFLGCRRDLKLAPRPLRSSPMNSPDVAAASRTAVDGYFQPDADPGDIKAFYAANGFLVMERAFDPDQVKALRLEATDICRGRRGAIKNAERLSDDLSDPEVLRRFLCIHFPHKASEVVRETLFNSATLKVLTSVIGPNVKCMQSMLFIKSAGKPGQAWHQDEDYIPTRDRSLTGGWIALDDATVENGCLWVIPGSHRPGVLWEQEWHGDRRFDCSDESVGFPYRDEDAIPVEVSAGSVVFFNGYLLHRSLPNTAPEGTYRRALVNHFMSCESHLAWGPQPDGVSSAKWDSRDVVVVAGQDPYAHRGYAEEHEVILRPDGRSGCLDWGASDQRVYRDE